MTISVAVSATLTDDVPGIATTRTRCVPAGVDGSTLRSGSAAPGTGSCMIHHVRPATAITAAATPSHVLRNAAPTMTSAATITTIRKRNASPSLRSGLRATSR